jgi:peptidylprolyl isomerase
MTRSRAHILAASALAAACAALPSLVSSAGAQPAAAAPAVAPRQAPAAPPDVAAPPADAIKTASGLATKVLAPGTGETHPGPSDMVTVQYTGWTADGKVFDSTYLRGRPSTFLVERVMPGWAEGVQLMVVGEKRRLWIPEELAFKGAEGRPKGPVVFDIELVEISPSPVTAPPDVARPPKDATKTRSGLAYRVLRAGTGTEHPSPRSTVTVHYTGWTTDGKMFDSSVLRGRPATFPLDQVIKGWTEGVPLMVVGEKTRFWIPQDLAYGGAPDKPRGMLVFDIELIGIEK